MSTKIKYKDLQLILVALIIGSGFSKTGYADTEAIEKRLQALEQEVAILKRQLELEKEDKAQKAAEVPIITASSKEGFSIKSHDDIFKLKIGGLIQADGRIFADNQKDNGTTDTFTVRRSRIILSGTVGKIFDYFLQPDFGSGQSTLVDAYGEFKIAPAWKIRGGKFKAPLGLERLQSDAVANFIETGLPSNLLSNREVGFQLSGDVLRESVNYAVGIFNGAADLGSSNAQDADNNNDKDVVARIFTQPFKNQGPESLKGLGVGLAGSYGHKEGASTPTYKSAGQVNIFSYSSGVLADGPHIRVTPQAHFYKGSLGLIGEYAACEQKLTRVSGGSILRDTFKNKSWQVSSNYILTGELASYKGFTSLKSFDLKEGTWGAFEAVGRYGQLNIDNSIFDNGYASLSSSVSRADEWGLGLNWYPYKNARLSLDFVQTDFERGTLAAGEDRKTENVILTRFQLAY